MNEQNFKRFSESYAKNLAVVVVEYPKQYPWPDADAPIVAERMMAGLRRGSANINGHAWRRTCKEFGIKHTKKAIQEFLNAPELPLWVQEFGPEFDVPKIITDVLKDCSWHNDVCPSFARPADEIAVVRLWSEHPDDGQREHPSGKRFWVYNQDTETTSIETDYAAEALQHFLSLTATK